MLKISDDRIRFTDAYVRKLALPAGKSDHIAWDPDLPGFGVRLRSGKASYVVQYRVGIEQRRKSLGDVRKVSVDDARGIARKRFAQVELGIDPDAEEAQRRADQAADAQTLEKVVELYLDYQKLRVRPNTYIAEERYLRRHCEPLRKKPVSKVTFEDIADLIRKLIQAHGATSAARARGALSSFFAWCMRQGIGVKANPTIGTDNPVYGKAPAIDNEGALVMDGYFDTRPSRVRFTLRMLPAEGDWKILGINVNVSASEAAPQGQKK